MLHSKFFDHTFNWDTHTTWTCTQVPFINVKSLWTQFVVERSPHHTSKFAVYLLQVSSRWFFGPPMLNWDTLLVGVSPPVNLSTSPVQIVTIGTYWTHLPSFNTSYRLLGEKIHCFSWKIVKKVIKNSLSLPVMSIIFWVHQYLWWLHCMNGYPSPFHQCKVTLNTICPGMKSTPRVEVCWVTCCR